ncbi:hypothetical protein HOD96_03195 [Candidatus Falkowbacteria bacterium]|jgi:hypothetical protein|nr:hypothetical protein [Candidatus Falkowbacteria bacterium]MBT4432737.1 hypothetical protein [Candidatus Falkowbacteria bacterium]
MKTGNLLMVWLTVIFLVSCVEVTQSGSESRVYDGVDSRVFEKNTIVRSHDGHRKIEGPGKKWIWYNSWHVTRRQPGVFKTSVGRAPYTLTNSFAYQDFTELTWAHYSFYVYQPAKNDPMRESYDCNLRDIEDEIWDLYHQSADIIRIDKLGENFYVVTYKRSDHKRFHIQEVDGYPPFNLGDNVGMAEKSILFDVKTKSLDPYGRKAFESQGAKMLLQDVLLLNPRFFDRPTELWNVFIPYEFFAKKFLYDHSGVKYAVKQSGDPMVVKIGKNGVTLRFSRKPELEEW